MPRVLSRSDVAHFRERLCAAAADLFARHGTETVTMRQIANAIGVSPMTPYRYFKDKDDILAAVRARGFDGLAQALEQAHASASGGAGAKGAAVGEAYIAFAFSQPNTYKLMFDLHQSNEADYPDLARAAARAGATMTHYVEKLVEEGVLAGDPGEIGRMFWAAAHGAVVLELAHKLPRGAARPMVSRLVGTLANGYRPAPRS